LRTVHARRGSTIVLVTHDAELAAMADGTLVLRDGRVIDSTLSIADPGVRTADSGARFSANPQSANRNPQSAINPQPAISPQSRGPQGGSRPGVESAVRNPQ